MSIIHPIIRHLTRVEQVWAMIPEQAGLRAHMIARALVEAGYLPDAVARVIAAGVRCRVGGR